MKTNLFFPSIRILRELRASMPVISEMWLSYKFRKTSCCRWDKCWILVIRLCWRLRSCSFSMMPSWGHFSRQRLEKKNVSQCRFHSDHYLIFMTFERHFIDELLEMYNKNLFLQAGIFNMWLLIISKSKRNTDHWRHGLGFNWDFAAPWWRAKALANLAECLVVSTVNTINSQTEFIKLK